MTMAMTHGIVTSHETALWRQKCAECDDGRPTLSGDGCDVIATTVDDVQSTAAVRVGKRHLTSPIAPLVCDVITGNDVITDEPVNGREMDAFFGVVGKTHRLAVARRRAAAPQDGRNGTGSGRRS